MNIFPGAPRLLKGALIGLDLANPLASIIVFQYNPNTMTQQLDTHITRWKPPIGLLQALKG